MIDAKHAQASTTAAQRRARTQQLQESRFAKAQEKKSIRAALKTVPAYIAHVEQDIQRTAQQGHNSTTFQHKETPEQDAKDAKLITYLESKGFKVSQRREYSPGEYDNMGDFNAPCNVWRDACWYRHITIKW